jgi:GT2 family glycosyltransferase
MAIGIQTMSIKKLLLGFTPVKAIANCIGRLLGRGVVGGEFIYFRTWLTTHSPTARDFESDHKYWASRNFTPLVSVIVPIYRPNEIHLVSAVRSVADQSYTNWELVLVDDGSDMSSVTILLQTFVKSDRRIKLTTLSSNAGISAATNHGVSLANGEICVFLDHDDLLRSDALSKVVHAFDANSNAQLIYSDEAKVDKADQFCAPYFKGQFSRALLFARNYVNHVTAVKRAALSDVSMQSSWDGSQDFGLILGILERFGPSALAHCPHILYFWRTSADKKSYSESQRERSWQAGAHLLSKHMENCGCEIGSVVQGFSGSRRFRFLPQRGNEKISIVIPTRDNYRGLKTCVEDIRAAAPEFDIELVVVDNGTTAPDALGWMEEASNKWDNFSIVDAPGEFNYSKLMNVGCAATSGKYLLMLNNDVYGGQGDWLTEMLGYARMPWVGAVGAKLLYPNGRLQHGGIVLGAGGVAGHLEKGVKGTKAGMFGHLMVPRGVSAVTAACLMVRNEVFDQVGGFDEVDFPVTFSDIDFCLRVRALGLENVWTPYATLTHHEGMSRGRDRAEGVSPEFFKAAEALKNRWGDELANDPYHNPNLDLVDEQVRLKW